MDSQPIDHWLLPTTFSVAIILHGVQLYLLYKEHRFLKHSTILFVVTSIALLSSYYHTDDDTAIYLSISLKALCLHYAVLSKYGVSILPLLEKMFWTRRWAIAISGYGLQTLFTIARVVAKLELGLEILWSLVISDVVVPGLLAYLFCKSARRVNRPLDSRLRYYSSLLFSGLVFLASGFLLGLGAVRVNIFPYTYTLAVLSSAGTIFQAKRAIVQASVTGTLPSNTRDGSLHRPEASSTTAWQPV
ncbi:Uu.00g024410.m01.CDS01 [Anthostomella pinea]|uniref:Uu.00g024410.m01.CDS01 n=1 Tax=Anthostomella pinea TaxID=933095 RepID=A0AAI8W075_9PEZI|nr:Uu.00g024410.m01.CDS01 [Anthostomella pinea]